MLIFSVQTLMINYGNFMQTERGILNLSITSLRLASGSISKLLAMSSSIDAVSGTLRLVTMGCGEFIAAAVAMAVVGAFLEVETVVMTTACCKGPPEETAAALAGCAKGFGGVVVFLTTTVAI